ncbi:MAG: DNA repair ATPase, partial [Moraxellaceae bacterium]
MSQDAQPLEQIVRESSAFDTIQRRLREQGDRLRQSIVGLNTERTATFGSASMAILGRSRVRTEQNAIARDVVQLGSQLLFGFNLQLGLRKNLNADDVFVLYQLDDSNGEFELTAHSNSGTFLQDPMFLRDFNELQQYYSNAFLSQLVCMNGLLLAVFQIGEKVTDVRVLRWELFANGSVNRYIDNRGERDLKFPDRFGFKWITATREMQVQGRQPHLNILDTIFVDNLRGDVTFKIENNTATGQGIFSDPVDVDSQSLDDGSFEYADLGALILVRILPFTEKKWRYYIFNRDLQQVQRIDQLAGSVVLLPENHGVIFPAGFYLSSGDLKIYEIPDEDFRFLRTIRAPNGEDVLFVFFAQKTGHVLLYR